MLKWCSLVITAYVPCYIASHVKTMAAYLFYFSVVWLISLGKVHPWLRLSCRRHCLLFKCPFLCANLCAVLKLSWNSIMFFFFLLDFTVSARPGSILKASKHRSVLWLFSAYTDSTYTILMAANFNFILTQYMRADEEFMCINVHIPILFGGSFNCSGAGSLLLACM